jgi:hypothetical protein
METVLGLFAQYEDAQRTVSNLREAGFSEEGISLFSHEEILSDVEQEGAFDNEASSWMKKVSASAVGLLGALAGLVLSDQKAETYTNGLIRGGALVVARATNREASVVKKIMRRYHAVDVQHIFTTVMGQSTFESEDPEPYYPLLWHRIQEA